MDKKSRVQHKSIFLILLYTCLLLFVHCFYVRLQSKYTHTLKLMEYEQLKSYLPEDNEQ